MEFIPLDKEGKKAQKKKLTPKAAKKLKGVNNQKTESTARVKVLEKKNVKNKYKETLALKRMNKASKKKNKKVKKNVEEVEEEEEKEEKKEEIEEEEEEEEEEDIKEEEEEEDIEDEEEEEEKELHKEEKTFRKKCQRMEEKMKRRLFIKLGNKMYKQATIKALHPDIRGVIIPKQKNSRCCWAVFASEEKANAALKQLKKNKDLIVTKSNPNEKDYKKIKERMNIISRRREVKAKLKQIWL